MKLLAIFIGGGLGSVLRYLTSLISAQFVYNFPLGTLLSNFAACIILAGSLTFAKSLMAKEIFYVFLVIGVCGGYSTFSTFSLETFRFFQSGMYVYGILNIALNLIFCLGIVWYFTR